MHGLLVRRLNVKKAQYPPNVPTWYNSGYVEETLFAIAVISRISFASGFGSEGSV